MDEQRKPEKPSPDFPLYAHASGKWAKKINGKIVYFGRWSDPAGALRAYQAYMEITPTSSDKVAEFVTLGEACEEFLAAKRERLNQGELSPATFREYKRSCQKFCDHLGKHKPLERIGPSDFTGFKAARSQQVNIVGMGNEITRIRVLFGWLKKSAILKHEINFGPEFRRASAVHLRRHRRQQGKKLFTAREIRLLLNECGVTLRAMTLLGINCGYGLTDCARLPLSAVDLGAAWLDFPRPKTEVDRQSPLWPETVAALAAALKARQDAQEAAATHFFVRPCGKPFDPNVLIKRFRATRLAAEIKEGGHYWLRHTFETVGGGAKDQVALNHIMGHADASMAAVYREEIDRKRLVAVTDFVRAWLFG